MIVQSSQTSLCGHVYLDLDFVLVLDERECDVVAVLL